MKIQMIGMDHSRAPVEIRERFSFTTAGAATAMEAVCALPGVEGCVLLSTCNRTELWVSASGPLDLPRLLCSLKGLDPGEYGGYLVCRADGEAVEYLFALASGLRSMILGEDQILAQVKEALSRAREAQCCGSTLEVLFRHAVTGAKQVKSQLLLSTANASAAELAIDRMGKDRSGRVEVLPGCSRVDYGERYRCLPQCDVVVSATSSPNVTIRAEELEACGLDHDVLLLDFAVPRDVDPGVTRLPHVTLYNIDRFSVPPSQELERQVREAETLLRQERERFEAWEACRDLIPRVEALGTYLAGEVDFRVRDVVKELPLSQEQDRVLTQAVESAAGKVLKKLMFAVRDHAGPEALRQCLSAMEQVTRDA